MRRFFRSFVPLTVSVAALAAHAVEGPSPVPLELTTPAPQATQSMVPAAPEAQAQVAVRYLYDYQGRLVLKIGNEGIRQYLYFGDSHRVLTELDEFGNVVASYSWSRDELNSVTRPGLGTFYPVTDSLGSIIALTNETGEVVARYGYDTWGNILTAWEAVPAITPYRFGGYRWQEEIGLYNANARYYAPEVGRFTTQDTNFGKIEDPATLNLYSYAHNRPTFFIDPSGHEVRVKYGLLEGDRPLLVAAEETEEVVVYSNPTNKQIQQEYEAGRITFGEAVIGQARNVLAPLAKTPDWQKSSDQMYYEAFAKSLAYDFTSPTLHTMHGMATENGPEFAMGMAGTTAMAVIPGAIGKGLEKGAGALVSRFPSLAKPITGTSVTESTRLVPVGTSPVRFGEPTGQGVPLDPPLQTQPGHYGVPVGPAYPTGQGTVPGAHNANVRILQDGQTVAKWREVSGEQTAAQKALGYPKSMLSSHTEPKGMTRLGLEPGQQMVITGQAPPCTPCKGVMNRAARETGGTIVYQWRQGGQTMRWVAQGEAK